LWQVHRKDPVYGVLQNAPNPSGHVLLVVEFVEFRTDAVDESGVGLRDVHDGVEFLLQGLGRRTAVACLLPGYGGETGQRGDPGRDFVADRAAQGALRLESAEFLERALIGTAGRGLVAIQTVQGFGRFRLLDGFETAAQKPVFHGLDRLELPGFADELVEGEDFHGAFRSQFLPQSFPKLVVLFLLVG
jgi:hypothetical protein